MYYFIFNGIASNTMGVELGAPAPVVRATERVQHVTIPGMSGNLTLLEGVDIYEPYIQTLTISVRQENLTRVYEWLRGDGYVTFSSQPEYRQKCRIINTIELVRISKYIPWYQGQIQFYCQPYKEPLTQATDELYSSSYICNNGSVIERPRILVYGESEGFTLNVGGSAFTLASVPAPGVIIDCAAQEVTSMDGQTLLTNLSSGEFPVIPVGVTPFSWTSDGVTAVRVQRAVRFL